MTKTSAQRKFDRGIEHMQTVCSEARSFQDAKAYVVRVETEARSRHEVHYDCFAVKRQDIPSHWPLLIGDAIQNLRSSLDHAVYTAAKGKGRTQFPIFEDPCEFQVIGRKDITTVPAAIRTIIEWAQPFNTIIDRPHTDALAVLADLSNFDKHRNITTTACYIDIPWVGHSGAVKFTDSQEGKPLATDKDTHVMSFILRRPKADEMKVYPDFAYEVRIERVRRNRRIIERRPHHDSPKHRCASRSRR